jgi:hypothetical protein
MPPRVTSTKMEGQYISGGRRRKSVVGLGFFRLREVRVS